MSLLMAAQVEGEGEQVELRGLQTQLETTQTLVALLSQQLSELKEQVMMNIICQIMTKSSINLFQFCLSILLISKCFNFLLLRHTYHIVVLFNLLINLCIMCIEFLTIIKF